MRLEIILKGKNNFKVPFNYNHILSAIIYNKIADLNFANELHSSKSFTFSQIYIPKRRIVKDGIIAKDGVISFYISSPNDFLIKSLVDGFLEDLEISFQNQKLTIQKIEALKTPEFSSKSEFKTLAPIIVRTKKEIDGELKIWDLAPSDKFFKSLENNLIKKYLKFNNLTKTDKKINIYSDMNFVKRKRISINKDNATTHHRAYMMDEFAYDVGIGEKNSMGFGMVKLLE